MANEHPDVHICLFGADALQAQLEALARETDGVRASEDIEFVHRMRVASRRLRGTLSIFTPCLPRKRVEGWTRAIRRIPLSGWSSIAASVDGTRLAVAAGNASTQPYYGFLYTSFDSGLTWTKATAPQGDWYGIASSADGSKLVAVKLADGIYVWRSVPSLGISSVNTNLVLYWPSNAASSRFVLQANEDLNTTNWTDALMGPTVSNQQYQVVTPPSASNIFYRLISR